MLLLVTKNCNQKCLILIPWHKHFSFLYKEILSSNHYFLLHQEHKIMDNAKGIDLLSEWEESKTEILDVKVIEEKSVSTDNI